MKNQNENAAVSDVTARMRTEASILAGVGGQYVSAATVAKKLREFADSIDAALKSERDAWEEAAVRCVNEVAVAKSATTTGNTAAMRNALLNALTRFKAIAMSNTEWQTCAESHVLEISAALSATANTKGGNDGR